LPSEANNPYRPPEVDPARAIVGVLDDALQTRSSVEFETVVTQRDQVDAVRRTTMRPDLRRIRRIRWLLLFPAALILFVTVIRSIRSGQLIGLSTYIFIAIIVLALYVTFLSRWLIRKHVKMNRDVLGPIKGWIDREMLWIENEHQTRCRSLSQLVGVAKNQRQLVLCFDPTHSLFETLPRRGFNDPDTIEILADNLVRARPFSTAKPFDSRRLEPPTDKPRFQPGDGALFYSGALYRDDIKHTPLEDSQRRARLLMIGQLVAFVSVCVGFIIYIGSSTEYRILALSVIGFIFIRALLRVSRAPLAGQADKAVFWQSAGWLDQSGIVSITVIGQTMSKWSAFDRAVITDRVISVRTSSGSLWHLIGRGQIADDSQWEAACQIVREHLPTA
jgi:hypothetical protein